MLNHPPQPSIIVSVCASADRRRGQCEEVRKRTREGEGGVCNNLNNTLTLHNNTITHTVIHMCMSEHEHAACTRARADKQINTRSNLHER